MARPLISVIVPTYNRRAMLAETIDSLLRQQTEDRFDYEVIVVNDRSSDDTKAYLSEITKQFPEKIRSIMGQGRGYTFALNSGLENTKGDWIAFFDDDQLASPDWLRHLLAAGLDQNADLVGGPIELGISRERRLEMGPVYLDMCGESHDITAPEKHRIAPPLPSGGNRMVRRKVFDRLGNFDEQMLTGGCDRDFLLRAQAAGCRMGWSPSASIRHMILIDRLTPERIKWYSLQWGCSFAYIDWKRWGALKTSLSAIARIGQALLVHLPLALIYALTGNRKLFLDRRSLMFRAQGYVRKTLALLAPAVFTQEGFFSRVEFRRQHEPSNAD